jgi:3-phenylpropionate/trans-cinnamate dioxygenase ferredoxin reductase subunit
MSRPIVIVGASLAGLRAAQATRAAGWEGGLVVVGEEPHRPYTRPPLSKELLVGAPHAGEFPCAELDVEWRLGVKATKLDLERRTVTAGDELEYSKLVIATGTRARRWPGETPAKAYTIRDLDDARALKGALSTARSVAIVGAGFIGCEVASSARKLGLDVTLIDIAELPMPALGPELGERCAELHREHGVELKLGGGVASLDELEADVIVVALGAVPNIEWLEGSGLTLDRGVVCDATLQAAPDVYAAGDIAVWPHPMAGGNPIRIEHWTNAAEQGTHVGRNLLAEEPQPYAAVPYFWTDQYDVKIQAVGLASQAQSMHPLEDRVLAGVRDGRVVCVVTFNNARRLAHYRRRIAPMPTLDELLAEAPVAA